uniref:Uncharacterized protein n=1 Tax=Anguilla anguilla TaxID=7936 RepID=A0A0E9VLE0_ANGAN
MPSHPRARCLTCIAPAYIQLHNWMQCKCYRKSV